MNRPDASALRRGRYFQIFALAGMMLAVGGCEPTNGNSDREEKHVTDKAVSDRAKSASIARMNARFAAFRKDPNLIHGKVLESATVNCQHSVATSADGATLVRIFHPMFGSAGYFHIVLKNGESVNISADFMSNFDRTERLYKLNLVSKTFRTSKPLDFRGKLLTDFADLVETIHAKCLGSRFANVTSYLLLSPDIYKLGVYKDRN